MWPGEEERGVMNDPKKVAEKRGDEGGGVKGWGGRGDSCEGRRRRRPPVAFLVAKDRWQEEQIFWAKMSIPNYEAESGS